MRPYPCTKVQLKELEEHKFGMLMLFGIEGLLRLQVAIVIAAEPRSSPPHQEAREFSLPVST